MDLDHAWGHAKEYHKERDATRAEVERLRVALEEVREYVARYRDDGLYSQREFLAALDAILKEEKWYLRR